MTEQPNDLERRIAAALDRTAHDVRPGRPPHFSWQQPTAGTRYRSRRARAWTAGSLLAAASAATVVVVALPGDAPTRSAGPHSAASLDAAPSLSSGQRSIAPGVRSGGESAHHGSAATLLLTAAHVRSHRGDATLAAGQYRYIRTVGPGPDFASSDGTQPPPPGSYTLDELWIPKDLTGVWLRRQTTHTDGPDQVDTWRGRCGDLYANTQDGPQGDPCTRPGTFGDPTPAFIAALPRDAGALYAQLRDYASQRLNPDKDHDVDSIMFTTINDLLSGGVITSDLTSTLYTVMSRIPGIVAVDNVANAEGRRGTGFRLSATFGRGADATRHTTTVIVDLGTGAYLGYAQVGPEHYRNAVSEGVSDRIGVSGD